MKNKVPLVILVLLFVMAALTACSKMPGNPQAAAPDANASTSNSTAAEPTTSDTSASPEGSSPDGVPFASKKDGGKVEAATSSRGVMAQPVTVPSGTPITVRLQNAVSSSVSNPGDRFDAVLDAPIVVNGRTVAPAGASATGRVVAARRSGHLKDPGMIQIALASVTIDGKSVPVSTSSVAARGASHKKRNWAMIGGGTGGGALIGGLVGGGKGALIGSAVGAGAGTTAAYATGKKDVGFGAERRLTFRLNQPIVLK